jgi:hypothetical protein
MATALDRGIRRLLDRAVRSARVVAEDGARKALTEIGVEDARKPDGLSSAKTELRNQLRAHAKSLGDVRAPDDSIKANRLVREIAYEHWHRALFARFLAENNLLIDPDHKVAVSLAELERIAEEERRDPIELAADWAEPMLPQIFRKDDPVLALTLPPETRAGIIEIVKGLPPAVFAADDSLGWVYQFWQADQKDRVNASEVKIGADELPAVTQLFTEDYMVLFLLENTLGAWWAGKVLATDPALAAGAASEDELREKTSPPGYRWTYLRFVREPREGETHETTTGPWRPAAGAFEGWPRAAKDITVLDPCMGSGHFLVFALPILLAFRRAEEEIDERVAVKAVLADNLFGLEIDPRCTQIAAFALALASWKRLDGPEPLPRLNLACSGLAIGLGKNEFLKLAERIADASGWTGEANLLGTERTPLGERAATRLRGGLERLYEMFERAPYLGSLIDPRRAISGDFGNLFEEGFEGLEKLLAKVLERSGVTDESRETVVTAQGIAKAAELLSRQFTLVSTNVPYLTRQSQSPVIRDYVDSAFSDSAADVANAMIERYLRGGAARSAAAVSPSSWLYQPAYKRFRRWLLDREAISLIVRLGPGAFEAISGEVVNVHLSVIHSTGAQKVLPLLELSDKTLLEKIAGLKRSDFHISTSDAQKQNPDSRVVFEDLGGSVLLLTRARSLTGLRTGDNERFKLFFWELPESGTEFEPLVSSELNTAATYSGRTEVLRWAEGRGDLSDFAEEGIASLQGRDAWGKRGIIVNLMSSLPVSIYTGEFYDMNCGVCWPNHIEDLAPLWCFLSSPEYHTAVRKIDRQLKLTTATLLKVPFDLAHWQRVAGERYPAGIPKPFSNDPTQWLFDGYPRGGADPNATADSSTNPRLVTPHGVRSGTAEHPLQVAVARLLGYRWPRQTGSSFIDCPAVPGPDEVDRSGLVDADGIVPLPALAGEADAATRLRELIRVVWGPDYGEGTIRELLAAEGAKATDLGTWLADEFFDDHCRLFHQSPFIWHVSDGVRGGFSALVNYHRLCEGNGAGRRLLEKLRDSYLGEWIATRRRALAAGEAGAEEHLIAAEHLRGKLTRIIEGAPPYDIFVRWKPLHRQPIGWEPDIDDGVRLNIRPFLAAKPKNTGRKDGCILRVTPRVKKHDGADRGAEPHREKEDFPWFWAEDDDVATEDFAGGPTFRGRRYNDFHYTREFKQRARDAKGGKE